MVQKSIKESVSPSWYSRPSSERSVISICLQSMTSFIEVYSKLSIEDFLDEGNRAVFTAMSALNSLGVEKFDLDALASYISDIGAIDIVGGYEYIDALFQSTVSKENLDVYVRNVIDASIAYKLEKKLRENAEYVREKGVLEESDVSEITSRVEDDILSLSLDTLKIEDGVKIGSNIRERLKEFESNPSTVRGLRSGFDTLDRLVNGFKPGSLSVLAARPKTGKSLTLFQWATHMCTEENIPILYIDTEMTTDEVQTRQLSMLSGVPERIIINGLYINDDKQSEAVYRAVNIMEHMNFTHKYMPGFKIEDVRSMVRKYKAKENIGAFFFDYIKMVDLSENFNETQTLGHITSSLKDLAGLLEIPVITAVQLKRDSHDKSKVGSDAIADSDKILRYCSLLMALTAKTKKEIEDDGRMCGTHRLQILDNRSGVSLYNGIDLEMMKTVLTVKESGHQSSESIMEQKELESNDSLFRR